MSPPVPARRGLPALAVALLLLLAPLPGARAEPAAEPPSAEEAFARARAAREAGDHEAALRWLQQAQARAPDPRYAFNIARTLEDLGRLGEAHATYKNVLASPAADAALLDAARARVARLEPLLDKAVVRFEGVPAGAVPQVDGEARPDAGQDLVLAPGRHLLCLVPPEQARVACWTRELAAGLRVAWPPAAPEGARGTVRWQAMPGANRLRLDGHPLLVDLGRLEAVELDVGPHGVGVDMADGSRVTVTLDVVAGQERSLPAVLRERGTTAVAGEGTAPAAGARGPGAWPWVVTGVGAAVVGAGAILLARAAGDRADVRDAAVEGADAVTGLPIVVGLTEVEARSTWRSAEDASRVGVALAGAGAAVAVAGVLWGVLAPRSDVRVGVSGRGVLVVQGGFP